MTTLVGDIRKMVLTSAVLVLGISTAAHGRIVTVDVKRQDVQSHAPAAEELGDYYVLQFAIPEKSASESLMEAYLELYVDAASDVDALATGGTTTLEVYPLKRNLTGEMVSSDLRSSGMKRTVHVGSSRKVKIDIREYVEYLLENPSENHGLVVGSLSGQRLDRFTLKHSEIASGIAARVTVVYATLGFSR